MFLSPECPLCESYSLTIRNLYTEYAQKGIQFYAIIPGTDYGKEQVIKYRNHYQLKGIPFYFDPKLIWVNYAQVSITPEVVVYNQKGLKIYQGRIDNWAYELAKKRTVITEHDLKDILFKISNKQDFKPYKTKAVGCFIN
jgi:hypothetical protein